MLGLLPKQHACFAIRYIGRAHVGSVHNKCPIISTIRKRLRPLMSFPPSKPICSVAVELFLTLCESMVATVGKGFLSALIR